MVKLSLAVLLNCFLLVSPVVSQESAASWREQLEYAKELHDSLSDRDCGGLHFINYTYKGKISSEKIKSEVLDSLFSPKAIYPVCFPPVIEKDTMYTENERIITHKSYPQFKLVTIGSLGLPVTENSSVKSFNN